MVIKSREEANISRWRGHVTAARHIVETAGMLCYEQRMAVACRRAVRRMTGGLGSNTLQRVRYFPPPSLPQLSLF